MFLLSLFSPLLCSSSGPAIQAIEILTEAYGNALMEFCVSGKKSLRLLPISGGIFSGYWGDSMVCASM